MALAIATVGIWMSLPLTIWALLGPKSGSIEGGGWILLGLAYLAACTVTTLFLWDKITIS